VFSKHGQKLDWYLPEAHKPPGQSKWPVILFIYGGAWMSGSKDMYSLIGAKLSKLGFVVVIPNYTLYPKATVPQMLEEVHEAALWIRNSPLS
jgi:acetyl esterase/lipase